jgi:hypothetical protein
MFSFIFLPFAVVWFWRGTWLVIDFYLWGLGPDPILIRKSILWGVLLAMAFIGITSEPVFARLTSNTQNCHILGVAGRVRTFILAWGTVSYWRVIWYIWDEFTGTGWVSAVSFEKICAFAIGRQFMIEEHADVTEKVTDQELVERTHREVEFRTSATEHYLTVEENEGAVEVDKTAEGANKVLSVTTKPSRGGGIIASTLLHDSNTASFTNFLVYLTDENGLGSAYHELQRPNLSIRRSQNDSTKGNRRLHSSFSRSR